MSGNEIDNFMFKGLSNLKYLDLSLNGLNNMSILSSLEDLPALKRLDLREIGWKGTVDLQKPDSFSSLVELYMSGNVIDKFEVPKDYRGLRNLKTLDLRSLTSTDANNLLQSLGSFPSLKKLDLSDSTFSGAVSTGELLNFTNLEDLSLDGSVFHTSPLPGIGAFTLLKRLSMGDCEVNGSLNAEGLCDMVHLYELYLNDNDLKDIPSCIANLTALEVLDISSNQFTENISSSPLKDLTSIRELKLSNNHFHIPMSLEPFFNLSKLKTLDCENNHIYDGKIESQTLVPKFQLSSIILSGYGDGGIFPKFLYHQYDLQQVDFSHIKLMGEFPNWLLQNNTKLGLLRLVNNSLSGSFQLPLHSHMSLGTLDISMNFFNGSIPIELATYLPKLVNLNMSTNEFDGKIPSSFGDFRSLENLDLSNNKLSGEIPEQLTMGCFSLKLLVLSNNNLQGRIFPKNVNLTRLTGLQLDRNQFVGDIPESLSDCSLLMGLYLSDNHLSGRIPRWLGNMSFLLDIIMSDNDLEGPIPTELCRLEYLEVLDLSNNSISGSLPYSCFRSIKQVHLSRNGLHGQLNDALDNGSTLVTLDLSHNNFSGIVPNWVGSLSQLKYLILNNNNLEGEVPILLCKLNQIHLIDLSHNNFYGKIPSCLDITALHDGEYNASIGNGSYMAWENRSSSPQKETVEFRTKNMVYAYQGRILTYMFGIDFSCNKLTGEIPHQIGNLTRIITLNLSHNNLTGPIPRTFSNLQNIESLDLSYNDLNGEIPPELVKLNFLGTFSVAHNNLSGRTPQIVGQFITFNESSYDGNPLLCGLPLRKSCNAVESPRASSNNGEDGTVIDIDIFYISFVVSYSIALLGFVAVLYVNPYWRRRWFYLVEIWMISCYYFVIDHL